MTPAKCPNPACPFLFDPSQVPPGAVIACPRCGMQFTLGPTPPPPPMPLYGSAPPADDLGLFEDRPNTDDLPTEDRPRRRGKDDRDGRRAPDDRNRDRPHRPAAGSGAGKLILYSVLGVLVVCGMIAGVLFLKARNQQRDRGQAGDKKELVFDKYKMAFVPPDGTWEPDDELKRAFKVNVTAMVSREPAGWIAVEARAMQYDATGPELHDMARQALAANIDELRDELPTEDATLGGVAGKRFTFEGLYLSARVTVKGEVYAVSRGKIAYLVYAFGADQRVGELNDAFTAFRSGIRFLGAGTPAGTAGYRKSFRSKVGTYTVTAADPLWRELSDPASRDADLGLVGLLGPANVSNPNTAEVLVFVRDKGADLRAHLTAQFDLPGNKPALTDITGDYQGDDLPSGPPNPTATISRFEVRYPNDTSSSRKFVVAATLDAGKTTVVAVGECPLRQRKSWEKRLVQLVGSLAGPD